MKVAVLGGGIAGISTAWHLQESGRCDVHLFERSERLGGHTHTHALPVDGGVVHVDTGFIVFNNHNYPNFSRWLETLQVSSQVSDMSFAVKDTVSSLEYGTTDLRAVLANPSQLVRPAYWAMWRDLLRFYHTLSDGDIPDMTLGDYLRKNRFSEAFIHSHIAPMCAALWSQPANECLSLALTHVVAFMRNHRMLQIADRPEWRVVTGGSGSYLKAFTDRFTGAIHCGFKSNALKRTPAGIVLDGWPDGTVDAVVLACHADQALQMLSDPTSTEREILSAMPFQPNQVVLHEDASFMPDNPHCWSSWNVVREPDGNYTITYWMNKLQGLHCAEQFFVTLNPSRQPDRVRWHGEYAHPHFTRASYAAQQRWAEISSGNTQFAGAYWGAGFHEDGFVSGQRAARALLKQALQRAA